MANLTLKNNYISVYDDVLTDTQCQHLIDKFEDSQSQWQKTELKDHRSFTEININMHKDWDEYAKTLFNVYREQVNLYLKDNNIDVEKQWPAKFGFEQIRFKKYEANDLDEFKEHVDVTDYNSARRFLVFFLYLNDNEGGHTTFPELDIQVQPKRGRLLMFPPTWTYRHTGEKPKDEPKYIIGSYLHYV